MSRESHASRSSHIPWAETLNKNRRADLIASMVSRISEPSPKTTHDRKQMKDTYTLPRYGLKFLTSSGIESSMGPSPSELSEELVT